MKISQNPPSQSPVIDKTAQTDKAQAARVDAGKASKAEAQGSASVEISEGAQLMRKAAEAAKSAPDIRHDKIADLKARIQAGTYEIDNDKLAEKILEEHLSTDFGQNKI